MGEKKEIQIVQGDGKDLKFSQVEDHINDIVSNKNKKREKKNIVIPEVKKENK